MCCPSSKVEFLGGCLPYLDFIEKPSDEDGSYDAQDIVKNIGANLSIAGIALIVLSQIGNLTVFAAMGTIPSSFYITSLVVFLTGAGFALIGVVLLLGLTLIAGCALCQMAMNDDSFKADVKDLFSCSFN